MLGIHSKPLRKHMNAMRINKYLADNQYASRRQADELIKLGLVFINGRKAVLGDTVEETDKVEVKKEKGAAQAQYYMYNKPIGVVSHSAQEGELDVKEAIRTLSRVPLFPIGRLDKDSHGLLILTNDGRITSKLLDPEEKHEKEYVVEVKDRLSFNFDQRMERGLMIEDGNGKKFKTKPCEVKILGERKFRITLTEGKKRQIRRMCEAVGAEVKDLKRIRIMGIELGHLEDGALKKIKGEELDHFLEELGIRKLA